MCIAWFQSTIFIVFNVVKQGGILSPLLFALHINALKERKEKAAVQQLQPAG